MKNQKKEIDRLPSECTSIVVGSKMTADGSRFISRSMDWDAMNGINFELHDDTECGPTEFVAKDSPFRCELPAKALGYSATPDCLYAGEWGSAGFNSLGVGMSSTESIFSSDEALKHDPLVPAGLAENCVFNITLPYIHSAREGVERLGKLIEKYGSAEGFGIQFIDDKETWYLENACGHLWLAQRIPDDVYFATGNQSRLRDYDPNDKDNFLAAPRLIEFAQEHGLYDPKKGKFDFHEAYARDVEVPDHTYNYPRVWYLQRMFSPSIKNDVTRNTFPVFAKAEKPITLADLRKAYRSHYDNTEHDPYLHNNPKEPYRPISIFRTLQTHILQVRPELPKEIGCINYLAMGMGDLSVFLPLYQGVKSYPEAYTKRAPEHSTPDSAYWTFRKVMTLGMVNYNKYAPLIKETYAKLEAEFDQRQKEMEANYLKVYKASPMKAQDMLQVFSDYVLTKALHVASELAEELMTRLTKDIQTEYLFHGA